MRIYILFKNDGPLLAYTERDVAEDDRSDRQQKSDGSIEQGIFHVEQVELIDGRPR